MADAVPAKDEVKKMTDALDDLDLDSDEEMDDFDD
jgi:hypothetical protein